MSATPRLEELSACFQGVTPAVLATCDRDGEPNVTYISQLHFVDDRHLALSCQFFNKTRRNLGENPHATATVHDPRNFDAWRIQLRYLRSETAGPLFDAMAARIQVIASHTGMAGVFRLLSADVCEVVDVERIERWLAPDDTPALAAVPPGLAAGPLTELRGLQCISERIARACSLERLLTQALDALDEQFGFAHAMLFVPEADDRLVVLATHGYGDRGVGGEIAFGDGLVGTVAETRRMMRLAGLADELRYGRTIRSEYARTEARGELAPELPLPGLCDAQAALALPLLVADRLVGVLAVESRDPLAFDEWDEAFLQIVGNQIAMGIERMQEDDDEPPAPGAPLASGAAALRPAPRRFVYYRNDDCIFVDGDYLIRNVPAKILRRLLTAPREGDRREFTNRELRLDPSLGLPAYRDNLESRLILLRRRLEEKCPEVRIVPVKRGRFALVLDVPVELVELDSA